MLLAQARESVMNLSRIVSAARRQQKHHVQSDYIAS